MRASTPRVPKALAQCPKGTSPEGRQGKCAVLAGCESVPTAASGRLQWTSGCLLNSKITYQELIGNRDKQRHQPQEKSVSRSTSQNKIRGQINKSKFVASHLKPPTNLT